MADMKISQLGTALGVNATDYFTIIDGSFTSTTKLTAALLKLFTTGDITALTTSDKSSVVAAINELVTVLSKEVLFFSSVAFSATTGTLATISNNKITSAHVVGWIVPANAAAITSDLTITTSTGSATISGTCTTATTADVLLLKKSN